MIRLIEANVLLNKISQDEFGSFSDMDIIKMIDEIPTVDAVSVVRCKDCKFYIKHGFLGAIQKWCERLCNEFDRSMPIATYDDDFCSYGERREVQRNFNASNTLDALEEVSK